MLSNTTKYAVRATIYIAQKSLNNEKIGIKKITDELDIPAPFLGKILQNLVKKKILLSAKGPNGGFSLGREASEISLLDIMEVIDGLDYFNTCLIGIKSCTSGGKVCPTHDKYGPIRKQLFELFKTETVEALVEDINKSGGEIII